MKKLFVFFTSCLFIASCGIITPSDPENGQTPEVETYGAVTGAVSNITYFNAEIYGKVNIPSVTSADLTFGVLYDTNSGVLFSTATHIQATVFDSELNFTVVVEGLEPETMYYYRSYIIQNGEVSYGEIKNFTTKTMPDAIDLGLSVLWHKQNLGSSFPEDYGGYYQWAGKEDIRDISIPISELNYPYCENGRLTKYNTQSKYGDVDGKTRLDMDDDIAHIKLGGKWRIPTYDEWHELMTECSWEKCKNKGVNGYMITSKKPGYTNIHIFLPACGGRDNEYQGLGEYFYYWSSNVIDGKAYAFCAFAGERYRDLVYRCAGISIRPVSD